MSLARSPEGNLDGAGSLILPQGSPPSTIRLVRTHPRFPAVAVTALATTGAAPGQQAALVGTLDGHTAPVYTAVWTPDGKAIITIITGGFGNTLRLWDAATGKELKKFEGHTGLMLAVAPSPDGRSIVSGSLDKTAKVWKRPASGPTRGLPNQAAGVHALTISPDGKLVAYASGNGVNVRDPVEPDAARAVRAQAGHAAEVESVAWRADDAQIVSGDKRRAIRPKPSPSARTGPGPPPPAMTRRSAFSTPPTASRSRPSRAAPTTCTQSRSAPTASGSPLLATAATCSSGTWAPANPSSNKRKVGNNTPGYGVAWSPDGKQLAVAASDSKAHIFKVKVP